MESRRGQVVPEVAEESRRDGVVGASEAQRPGGEHLRAGGRLVVRHLPDDRATGEAGVDGGQHDGAGRRVQCRRVELDAVPRSSERRAVFGAASCEQPRRCGSVRNDVGRRMAAAVVAAVLDADQSSLRPRQVPPELDPPDALALPVDAPEEVVRGEECEITAQVAVALNQVVHVPGHVLLVAGEDDQVVAGGEVLAGTDLIEVIVREEVGLATGMHEEAQKAALLRAVVRWLAGSGERPRQEDAAPVLVDVPGVAAPVAVRVEEVVRLPAIGRQDHGDAVAPPRIGPNDERGEHRRPSRDCREAGEVQAARPLSEADADEIHAGTAKTDPYGRSPRTADARPRTLRSCAQDLQLDYASRRGHAQGCDTARGVRGVQRDCGEGGMERGPGRRGRARRGDDRRQADRGDGQRSLSHGAGSTASSVGSARTGGRSCGVEGGGLGPSPIVKLLLKRVSLVPGFPLLKTRSAYWYAPGRRSVAGMLTDAEPTAFPVALAATSPVNASRMRTS